MLHDPTTSPASLNAARVGVRVRVVNPDSHYHGSAGTVTQLYMRQRTALVRLGADVRAALPFGFSELDVISSITER